MTHSRNYVNFSMTGKPPIQLGSVKIVPTGQGSGMLGVPGDFTPPSRFVRAVAFSQSVFPPKTEQDAVLQAFKILNNFDILKGSARDGEKDANGNIQVDYTLWTGASDLKARRYLFRTYDNSQIRSVDLMNMNVDGKDIVKVSIKGDEVIKNITPTTDGRKK
jgi:choloylglycine hydrolase